MTTRTLDLDALTLSRGKHHSPDRGLCLMEAVAYITGQEHTDYPDCVSPVLARFGRELNDQLDDEDRDLLKPLIHPLAGTGGDGHYEQRGLLALDWYLRTYTPAWLDLAGLTDDASKLRDLPPISGHAGAAHARPLAKAAEDKATARANNCAGTAVHIGWTSMNSAAGIMAAEDAAVSTAGSISWMLIKKAGGTAAEEAAEDAAGLACRLSGLKYAVIATQACAWTSAWYDCLKAGILDAPTWNAASEAIITTTRDSLTPTVVRLQESCIDLYARMIDVRG